MRMQCSTWKDSYGGYMYIFLPAVWAGLTKQVGALWDGEFITGWDIQWSHHIDVGAHPLIHSGGLFGTNSGNTGLTGPQGSGKPLLAPVTIITVIYDLW